MLLSLVSCGGLVFDETTAHPLVLVSTTPTPENQEIRSLVQQGDLVYTAAGSGGILVYRIVGDEIKPVPELSITNLFSPQLEQVFVRTVEVLQTERSTNLIFSYDTIQGGGVGIAEISSEFTRPLGSLAGRRDYRIRKTVTSQLPDGSFQIILADENRGILTYKLSFISNSFLEQPKIATLIDLLSKYDIFSPSDVFAPLSAPSLGIITNVFQITNVTSLLNLALSDEEKFNSFITNIPFLNSSQRDQLGKLIQIEDKSLLTNIVNGIQSIWGEQELQNILKDPDVLENLVQNFQAGLTTPEFFTQYISESLLGRTESLEVIEKQNPNNTIIPLFEAPKEQISLTQANTLYQNALTANKMILEGKSLDTLSLHDTNINPFTNRSEIGNARKEIETTLKSIGRRLLQDEDNIGVKDQLLQFNAIELQMLFQTAFQQAGLISELMPILNDAGVNLTELYQLLQDQQFYEIVNRLDGSVLATILRTLPQTQIKTEFIFEKTNTVITNIVNMEFDDKYLYVASGFDGFYIVDRISGEIIDHHHKLFSEVTMVIPFEFNGKQYYVVTDKLDGLTVYHRQNNHKIGNQVSRIALVGDAFSVFPYGNILWVADGINGVLGVRMTHKEKLIIESEEYVKQGISYSIGAARRREVLASYGADGLKRLRLTNILSPEVSRDQGTDRLDQVEEVDRIDFFDRVLEWSRFSEIAQFLRKLFEI